MTITNGKFEKQDVFEFSKEVKCFLKLLQGAIIQTDKNALYNIEKSYSKLEKLTVIFEPTIYEEYSYKVKMLYNTMISNRKEYNRVVNEKCYQNVIDEYKSKYENSVEEYQKYKLIRNSIKVQMDK